MKKKLSLQDENDLIIKKQRANCTICNGRGYTFIIDGFERKAKPCECSFIKKPQEPVLPFRDDMGDIILEDTK